MRLLRGSRAVLTVGGVLGAAALVGLAWVSYDRGSDWEDRAGDRAERIAALEGELQAADDDIRELESRVDELTAEVAAAQDQRSLAELGAEEAQELANLAGAVASDLASCVQGTSELVRIVGDLEAHDPGAARAFAQEVDEVCGRALAGNDLLQESLG
jgi:hypothetical protein